MQGHPARDQHLQTWAVREQIGYEVCRGEDMLNIIEKQQALFVLEESTHLLGEWMIRQFTQSQHVRHGLWNERGIAESCQFNPGEAIGKTIAKGMSELEREPGLAYPSGSSDGAQTHTSLS